jgi:hypothetical protein
MRVMGVVLSLVFLGTVVYAIHHAATQPGVVADRVTAVLHLPAPPPKPSEDPTQPEKVVPAPPPQVIALSLRDGFWSAEVNLAGTPRSLHVAPRGGELLVAATGPDDTFRASTYRVGADGRVRLDPKDAPEGTQVEVIVQRGGLSAHAGGGPDGSARAMGKGIFEEWLLPFEIVSLLLTGAIFGTVVLTKRRLA